MSILNMIIKQLSPFLKIPLNGGAMKVLSLYTSLNYNVYKLVYFVYIVKNLDQTCNSYTLLRHPHLQNPIHIKSQVSRLRLTISFHPQKRTASIFHIAQL